jgi:hypothetical protein
LVVVAPELAAGAALFGDDVAGDGDGDGVPSGLAAGAPGLGAGGVPRSVPARAVAGGRFTAGMPSTVRDGALGRGGGGAAAAGAAGAPVLAPVLAVAGVWAPAGLADAGVGVAEEVLRSSATATPAPNYPSNRRVGATVERCDTDVRGSPVAWSDGRRAPE